VASALGSIVTPESERQGEFVSNTAAATDGAAEPVVDPRPPLRHRGALRAAAFAVAGLLGGILIAVMVLGAGSSRLVAPNPRGARVPAAQQGPPDGFAPLSNQAGPVPLAQHVPPVEVAVPAIAVRSALVGLRLNADGTLQVPGDYARAGWYSQGPAPGDAGQPAVIVGHVDSTKGPAIFFRLRQLRAGDAVLIRRADGSAVRFVVYRTTQYPKDNFPAGQVYAPTPDAELRLITCTGTFNRAAGSYLDNFVVYAKQQPAGAKSTQ